MDFRMCWAYRLFVLGHCQTKCPTTPEIGIATNYSHTLLVARFRKSAEERFKFVS
jgi:hypothetical protein